MGALFSRDGKKKKRRRRDVGAGGVSAQDRAVLDLKNARDRLRRFQGKLEAEAETLTANAGRLLRAGKRDRALLVLRTRRFRETKVAEVDAQLLTLEEMVATIEWETAQVDVVAALRAGTDALNALHADALSVDAVAQLMDETADALETEKQISALLGGAAAADDDDENAALLAELDALCADASPAAAAADDVAVAVPAFPDAPTALPEAAPADRGRVAVPA